MGITKGSIAAWIMSWYGGAVAAGILLQHSGTLAYPVWTSIGVALGSIGTFTYSIWDHLFPKPWYQKFFDFILTLSGYNVRRGVFVSVKPVGFGATPDGSERFKNS